MALDFASAPLVSVVTPSFNMARYLPETLESIFAQDYPNIEVIVVDGGSTDETPQILASYGDRIRTITGKDKGPSDAAHRGFLQARGEILVWLNADDTFLPGAVRTAAGYLNAHPEVDVVYGEGWWIVENGRCISRYPTLPWDPKVLERDCFICQPAAFMRASSYRRCPLDPDINRSFDSISGFAWRSGTFVSTPSWTIWPTPACTPAPRPSMSARPSSTLPSTCSSATTATCRSPGSSAMPPGAATAATSFFNRSAPPSATTSPRSP